MIDQRYMRPMLPDELRIAQETREQRHARIRAGMCPGGDFPRDCPNPQHPIGCGPRGYMQKRYFTDWRPNRDRLPIAPDESVTDHDAEPRVT